MFNKNVFFEKIFEIFSKKKIPNIDLHLHTNYTDGEHSPEEMINFSKKKCFSALLFSEHSRRINSEDWFFKFEKEIRSYKVLDCDILVGTEVKVLNLHGDLDLSDKIKDKCDIVMGSIHRFPGEIGDNLMKKISHSKEEAVKTEFMLSMAAIENPNLDILGHPMGMSIKRFNCNPSIDYFENIIKKCKKFHKVFEINSRYHENINELLRLCIKHGTLISIGSNAHRKEEIGLVVKHLQRYYK
jgi:histidinol phosphatase-like PHP family hydrolase